MQGSSHYCGYNLMQTNSRSIFLLKKATRSKSNSQGGGSVAARGSWLQTYRTTSLVRCCAKYSSLLHSPTWLSCLYKKRWHSALPEIKKKVYCLSQSKHTESPNISR